MRRSTKVVVTNRAALVRKHGFAGMKKIDAALGRLRRADAKRGLATRVIALDRAADMKPFGHRVSNRRDARQAKRAIDEICRALEPDYLMILGAPDVVPHVRLRNTMAVSRDADRRIESDLPYACDAPYSVSIKDFLGPTRVVGRLPDVAELGDTAYLVRLLDTARGWRRRPASDYRDYFALSTESWRHSTRTTVRKLFGSAWVRLSPSEGPYWTVGDLQGRVHLINCHGDTADPEYYGESEVDPDDTPSAHAAAHLRGRVQPGTVVAAECCFGAELYGPDRDGHAGICQAYLGEGAWAFFGSTTTAYGPSEGNNFADLICGSFLRSILEGASVGRAALEARQKYIRLGGYMEMIDLKTIAQFLLLGDPSIHTVETAKRGARQSHRAHGGRCDGPACRVRRERLARTGKRLPASTACVAAKPDARAGHVLRLRLRRIAKQHDGDPRRIESFRLHAPGGRVHAPLGRRLVRSGTVFHLIVLREPARRRGRNERLPRRDSLRQRLLVVREAGGRVTRVVEAFRH